MNTARLRGMVWRRLVLGVSILALLLVGQPLAAVAAAEGVPSGGLLADLTFDTECPYTSHGAGVAFDGESLWYTCNPSGGHDLFRADPATGRVTGSWRVVGGLGAIAYDANRNGIWAGMFGAGTPGDIVFVQLDGHKSVETWSVAFNAGSTYWHVDGMAYDGIDDTLYFSPDGSTIISHFATDGTFLGDEQWAGSACQNSGLAIGGDVLLQDTNSCFRIHAADKHAISQELWNFSVPTTAVHNEGLACDVETFAPLGHQAVWVRVDNQARVFAFKLPDGTCGTGGLAAPSSPGSPTIVEYDPAGRGIAGLTTGPDGNIWYVQGSGTVGRITMQGDVMVWPIPSAYSNPQGITVGADGALWFTEYGASKIGRITTSGDIAEYAIPGGGNPAGITLGPDGNVWFAALEGRIGKVTPSGEIAMFAVPTAGSGATGITAGPDGALWFTEYHASKIGRITTSGVITEFDVPLPNDRPTGIATGPDGNLWFGQEAGSIGRITPDGAVDEFPTPTTGSTPWIVTAGPDGNVWFAEYTGNRLGRITPAGTITEFPLPPAPRGPWNVTFGPDGNLWFGEYGAHKIGRFTPPDYTPPEISAEVSGVRGSDGWHISDVTVTWTVSDAESEIAVTEGCDPSLVAADTAASGVTLTCSATSRGGSASRSVVVRRDATAPVLAVVGPSDGAKLELCGGSPVRPSAAPYDPVPGSGLDGTEGDDWVKVTRPTGVGSLRYRAWATDLAGNSSNEDRSYAVIYGDAFGGFLQPKSDGSSRYKVGSVVKVEFRLACGGAPIRDALAMLMLQPGDTRGQDVPSVPASASTSRNTFTYSAKRGSYVFSLPTGSAYLNPGASTPVALSPGTWTMRVLLDDGSSRATVVRLTR